MTGRQGFAINRRRCRSVQFCYLFHALTDYFYRRYKTLQNHRYTDGYYGGLYY